MRWFGYVKQLEWGASFEGREKEGEKDPAERGMKRKEEGAGKKKEV